MQETPVVLGTELLPFGLTKSTPNTVLMPFHRQGWIGDDLKPFILEMEAVIDVEVSIEPEALPHQTHVFQSLTSDAETRSGTERS